MTFWLCVGMVIAPVQSSAQQQTAPPTAPAPVVQGTDADQPKAPAADTPPSLAFPGAPADDQSQPATTPKPATPVINPKTGLPYTAEELREKEIDKYDPLKRDTTTPPPANGATPLTDRKQPDPVTEPAAKIAPLPGSVAASDQAAAAATVRRNHRVPDKVRRRVPHRIPILPKKAIPATPGPPS